MTVDLSKQSSSKDIATLMPGDSLKDKSALITGGASGLGAGIALQYALRGAYVTLADIDETKGQKYCEELKNRGLNAQFIKTDVTSWNDQLAAFKAAIKFSPSGKLIDIVVAAAGVLGKPFLLPDAKPVSLDNDPVKPDTLPLEVNSIGLYYTAALAKDYFIMSSEILPSSRSLVLIASISSYIDISNNACYAASKYAVRGLFRNIRHPFADLGFRVNLIAPWVMDTPMAANSIPVFRAVGAQIGDVNDVYTTALRCVDDSGFNGRAFACGPKRTLDLEDDIEGGNAGKVLRTFHETELPDWDLMKARMKKLRETAKVPQDRDTKL